jgi:single-stranded DNA-specific DHH superfamily exonuclease
VPSTWAEIKIKLSGRGLIIHHWDTDGICSTRLLLDHLEADNITPPLGEYAIPEEVYAMTDGYRWVLVVDMAMPEEDLRRLSSLTKVIVIDHHSQPLLAGIDQINPIAEGGNSEDYPACAWVVNTLLGNPLNMFTVLGIIGDRGSTVKDNPRFWPMIQSYMAQTNISFEDLEWMVNLIDSSFKLGNRKGVAEAPHFLRSLVDFHEILTNKDWIRNLEAIEDEIRRVLSEPTPEISGIAMKLFASKANIISNIARELSWKQGLDCVVVNTGFFPDANQIYARSTRKDMVPMIKLGVLKGFSVGGKKDVIGAVVLKDETEEYVQDIVEYLLK